MDSNLPINPVDLAIIVILVISALLAFFRGLVHEVLGVGAWIGAALVTLYAYLPVQQIARQFIAVELVADIAAGAGLFLVCLIVFSLISRALGQRVRESGLGALDRTLGIVFGLVRGAVIVCLAWIALTWLMPPEEHPSWLREARALPLVAAGADMLRALTPAELRLRSESVVGDGEVIDRLENLDNLLQPTPAGVGKDRASDRDAGYNDEQRRELQRLIETQQ